MKKEIYRVAGRYRLNVILVCNSWMRTPDAGWIELVVVNSGPDEADNWIEEHVQRDDIVVTGDIPLASRCLKKGAQVLGNTGRPFTENNIGDVLSLRNLLTDLREQGMITSGPAPMAKKDRSRFLQELDKMIVHTARKRGGDR